MKNVHLIFIRLNIMMLIYTVQCAERNLLMFVLIAGQSYRTVQRNYVLDAKKKEESEENSNKRKFLMEELKSLKQLVQWSLQ